MSAIFKAQSNENISKLYQALGCEHFLIQPQDSNSTPSIPALTPLGFAQWMTIFIMAYPNNETKRFASVILALPIDADGETEDKRLPKQISRHLLPEKEDRKSRILVEDAISDFLSNLGSASRRKRSTTPPPTSRHSSTAQTWTRPVEIHQTTKTSPPTSRAPPLERERNPYAGAPSTTSDASSNEPSTSRPGRTNSTSYTGAPTESNDGRHQRTQSTASQNYAPPPRAGASSRRPSSPPMKKYSDSTPDIGVYKDGPPLSATSSNFSQHSQPFASSSSYGPSPTVPPPPPHAENRDPRDDRTREHYRKGTTEESRMTSEFNSPRDAERWDKLQDLRAAETDRPYEHHRASISGDSRPSRGAAYEDWYREPTSARPIGDRRY